MLRFGNNRDNTVDVEDSTVHLLGTNKRRRLRRFLLRKRRLIAIALIIIVLLIIKIALIVHYTKADPLVEKCINGTCRAVEEAIGSYANFELDPCDDFYDYACGNFMKVEPRPPDRNSWSVQEEVTGKMNDNLIKLMSKRLQEDSEATKKAYDYYESCVSEKSLNVTPVYEVVKAMGRWPLWFHPGKKFEKSVGLEKALKIAFSNQCFPFIDIQLMYYDRKATPQLGPPTLTYTFFNNPKAKSAFMGRVLDIMKKLQKLHDKKRWMPTEQEKLMITKVYELEKKINEAVNGSDEFWHAYWGKINLYSIKNVNLSRVFSEHFQQKILKNGRINIKSLQYFDKLKSVFEQSTEDELGNYLAWTVMRCITDDVEYHFKRGERFFDDEPSNETLLRTKDNETSYADADGKANIFGPEIRVSKRITRELLCAREVKKKFSYVIGASYAKEYLHPSDKDKIRSFCEHSKKMVLKHDPRFLDEPTKARIKGRLKKLRCQLLYPSFVMDKSELDKYYEKYKSGGHYLGNTLNHRRFLTSIFQSILKQGRNLEHWVDYEIEMNGYFDANEEIVRILPGLMLAPFFYPKAPLEVNWGSMGTVMTHELTHFILESDVYLSRKATKLYDAVKECFVEQFGKFQEYDYKVDGNISVYENLADSGGLWLAFAGLLDHYGGGKKAWEKLMEKTELDLELTRAQLFFVAFAQRNCAVYDRTNSPSYVNVEHTFNNIRLIGTIQNSPHFSKAFKCPLGSPYYPEFHCNIYEAKEEEEEEE